MRVRPQIADSREPLGSEGTRPRPPKKRASARRPIVWLLTCLIAGCQSFSTNNFGPSDTALVTSGYAHAAASGEKGNCPPQSPEEVADSRPPTELAKVAHETYRLEPPDILIIGLISTTPKDPYFLKSLDIIRIIVAGTSEEQPIAGEYQIQPGGQLSLGPSYGNVQLEGLTLEEARDAIARRLQGIIPVPEVSISLVQASEIQQLFGERIVAPDGTVNLGIYGSVHVAGLTIQEARLAMEERLAEFIQDPQISIDVFAYNSKTFYVVVEGAGFGDQIFQRPIVGNETVLDAVAALGGISQASSKRMWISRPSPHGTGCDQIIPVNWNAITRGANTATNYQLLPGDRLFIAEDRMIAASSLVNRVLNPVERAFGFTLLGSQTIQALQRFPLAIPFFGF